MSIIRILASGRTAAAVVLVAASALGDRNDPGSLLVFPEYDSRPGAITFLTVTNVSHETIRVHFNYVDGETCLKSNAYETLTGRDTVTLLTQAHAPGNSRGFCFAYASGISPAGPVTFNYLIGSALVYDGVESSEYSINALIFDGMTGDGELTDIDHDGIRDLDGNEYSMAPDRIAVPRFIGQLQPGEGDDFLRADLVLVGLTGTKFSTTLNFLIYNDNEEAFSAQHTFDCWDRVPLLSISGAFGNTFLATGTDHDPGEIIGLPGWESGWFEIDGSSASSSSTTIIDPAFLAVLVEIKRLSSAGLAFTLGEQANGDLLPTSVSGD